MSTPAIDVRGIAGHIGAEITGVWLGPDYATRNGGGAADIAPQRPQPT